MAPTADQVNQIFQNAFGQAPEEAGWSLDTGGDMPVYRKGGRVLSLGVVGEGRNERVTGWNLDGEQLVGHRLNSRSPESRQRQADALGALNEAAR